MMHTTFLFPASFKDIYNSSFILDILNVLCLAFYDDRDYKSVDKSLVKLKMGKNFLYWIDLTILVCRLTSILDHLVDIKLNSF